MDAEDRIKNVDQEDQPNGKVLQSSVRDAVGTRSLAGLKDPKGCLNLARDGQMWFAGRA
jgi:hypothetical protein